MNSPLDLLLGDGRVLLVAAADLEARAIIEALAPGVPTPPVWCVADLSARVDLVVTGVGKANAAGAVARVLDPGRHELVLNLGIAGSLPGSALALGASVLAEASVFADEGVLTPGGFTDLEAMGFPIGPEIGTSVPVSPGAAGALARICHEVGLIATVSTCSGTDAHARAVVERTGALAEAMEGAAVGLAVTRVSALTRREVAFAELRVISNTTGDRERQEWDIAGAERALADLARAL